MSGSRSRTKGYNFERKMAIYFKEHGFNEARRGIQYRDGAECPDVQGVKDFWIECKIGARPNIFAAMDQAVKAKPEDLKPVVITKKDRCDILVTLKLEDFVDLIT